MKNNWRLSPFNIRPLTPNNSFEWISRIEVQRPVVRDATQFGTLGPTCRIDTMKGVATVKWKSMMTKALHLGAFFILLASPVVVQAGTVTVVSDSSWNVIDSNGNWVGISQNVCLNATHPSNCPVSATPTPILYGYTLGGWNANLSSLPPNIRWIWAPNITGSSSPAASQEFTFQTDFYLCEPPLRGTIYVASDDSAEVSVNGTTLSPSSINHSALTSVNVPAAILYGSSTAFPPVARPNRISVKAKNGPNPTDCGSDQYKCNPAGVVLGASFEYQGNPTCTGYNGGIYSEGQSETLSSCSAGQTGSVYHTCLCGNWLPNVNSCVSPPPTCTSNGASYNVGASESISCPAEQVGSASRTCIANNTWGAPNYSKCAPPPPLTCNFTYSEWGECQSNNTQTRTVLSSSPATCTGGSPDTTRICPNPPLANEGDKCWDKARLNLGLNPDIAICPSDTECRNRLSCSATTHVAPIDRFCDPIFHNWPEPRVGTIRTSDNDLIEYKIEPNSVAADTVEFVLKLGTNRTSCNDLTWRKELILIAGDGRWTLHVEDARRQDVNGLYRYQLPNGRLLFRKKKFPWGVWDIHTLHDLDQLPSGARVTFTWVKD